MEIYTYESLGGGATVFKILEREHQYLCEHLPASYLPKQPEFPRTFFVDWHLVEWQSVINVSEYGSRFTTEKVLFLDKIFATPESAEAFMSRYPEKELRQMIYLMGANAQKAGERLIKYGIPQLYAAEFAYYQVPKMKREHERIHLEARLNQYLKQAWEGAGGLDAWFALTTDALSPQERVALLQTFVLPPELAQERKPRTVPKSINVLNPFPWDYHCEFSPDYQQMATIVSEAPIGEERGLVRGFLMGQDGCYQIFLYRSITITDRNGTNIRHLANLRWSNNETLEIWYPKVDISRFEFLNRERTADFEGKTVQIKYIPYI